MYKLLMYVVYVFMFCFHICMCIYIYRVDMHVLVCICSENFVILTKNCKIFNKMRWMHEYWEKRENKLLKLLCALECEHRVRVEIKIKWIGMEKFLIYTKSYVQLCLCDIFEYWRGFCMNLQTHIHTPPSFIIGLVCFVRFVFNI